MSDDQGAADEPPPEPARAGATAEELLRRANARGIPVESNDDLARAHATIDLDEHVDRRDLRRLVGVGALVVMIMQILIADWVFIRHAEAVEWRLSATAITAWMGATVIEVIAVVLVIARSLFPQPPATQRND